MLDGQCSMLHRWLGCRALSSPDNELTPPCGVPVELGSVRVIEVRLPPGGDADGRAELGNVLVTVGQLVSQGEVVAEVETDKVTVEVEAPESGEVVEILVRPGQRVEVGDVLLRIEGV